MTKTRSAARDNQSSWRIDRIKPRLLVDWILIDFCSIFLWKMEGKSLEKAKKWSSRGLQKAPRFWVDFLMVLDVSRGPFWRPGGAQDASRTRWRRARTAPGGAQEDEKSSLDAKTLPRPTWDRFCEILLVRFWIDFWRILGWTLDGSSLHFGRSLDKKI